MDDLVLESCRQQMAFVHRDTRGRSRAGLNQVGNNAGIIQVPMSFPDFLPHANAFCLPIVTGLFILVSIVPVLHHKVDSRSPVSIIVVVGLPHRAERINRDFPVVSEIPTQCFNIAAIKVAAKHHSLLVWLARIVDNVARHIEDWFTVGCLQLLAFVTEVEIQFAVRARHE